MILLKVEKNLADLMCGGRLLHILDPVLPNFFNKIDLFSLKAPNMEPCNTPKVTIDIIDAYRFITSF